MLTQKSTTAAELDTIAIDADGLDIIGLLTLYKELSIGAESITPRTYAPEDLRTVSVRVVEKLDALGDTIADRLPSVAVLLRELAHYISLETSAIEDERKTRTTVNVNEADN